MGCPSPTTVSEACPRIRGRDPAAAVALAMAAVAQEAPFHLFDHQGGQGLHNWHDLRRPLYRQVGCSVHASQNHRQKLPALMPGWTNHFAQDHLHLKESGPWKATSLQPEGIGPLESDPWDAKVTATWWDWTAGIRFIVQARSLQSKAIRPLRGLMEHQVITS